MWDTLPPGEGEKCAAMSRDRATIFPRCPEPCNLIPTLPGPGIGSDGLLGLGEVERENLFLLSLARGIPVARLVIAVPFSFDFAFDAVTADLAIVFGGDLVPVELTGHREGDLIPFQFAICDRGVAGLTLA